MEVAQGYRKNCGKERERRQYICGLVIKMCFELRVSVLEVFGNYHVDGDWIIHNRKKL